MKAVGRPHETHDDAWAFATQIKKAPGSPHRGPMFIHDQDTGNIHGMSGTIIGNTNRPRLN